MTRTTEAEPPVLQEIDSTPEERAAALAQRDRYLTNLRWYSDHVEEIAAHRGNYICVAGKELFVGTDSAEVLARARAKHPADAGATFSKYISPHTGPKVYAN